MNPYTPSDPPPNPPSRGKLRFWLVVLAIKWTIIATVLAYFVSMTISAI